MWTQARPEARPPASQLLRGLQDGAALGVQQVQVCAALLPQPTLSCAAHVPSNAVLSCGRHVAKPPFFPSCKFGHRLKHGACLGHGFMTSTSTVLSFRHVVLSRVPHKCACTDKETVRDSDF